ncbi:MAG: 4a-hydroxytetrahydrobiopterin dehydratase [Dehalococcoidia bacterium]|nr:4a-hydroxytetrahydrobiopterin dehydratase [Dehalococcoidia bacterium]
MSDLLSSNEITKALSNLSDWNVHDGQIKSEFIFSNFVEALSFIVKIGVLAEKADHHPEIWNVYNRVSITLSTHDAGGVTDKDIMLASEITNLI